MAHQERTDAAALPGIDHHEGHLRPPGLKDDISTSAYQDLSACVLYERHQGGMILEIDVHEESALLLREVALHHEEATLQRLHAGLFDRSKHVRFIFQPECADFNRAAVSEKFARGVADSLWHGPSCAGKRAQQ